MSSETYSALEAIEDSVSALYKSIELLEREIGEANDLIDQLQAQLEA